MCLILTTENSIPHGLALKLSPQNPSASPVLEVASLLPVGLSLALAPVQFWEVALLPYREFPYKNFFVSGSTPP